MTALHDPAADDRLVMPNTGLVVAPLAVALALALALRHAPLAGLDEHRTTVRRGDIPPPAHVPVGDTGRR